MPSEAKIHFSALDFFEHEVRGSIPSGDGWKRTPATLENAVLKVEFGLGTTKGMAGIDMAEAVTSWRETVQRSKSSSSSSSSAASKVMGRGRWGHVQQLTHHEAEAQCDLSGLQVDMRKVGSCC